MNNTMFLGRVLRVGRAEDNSTRRNQRKMKDAQETYKPAASASASTPAPASSAMSTAQVHVMFTVHSLDTIVSEVTLREIFGQMGNLEDVLIKKNVAYDGLGLQSGYGFVHYGLDEKGIESALRAVDMMNHRHMGGVVYECSLTHGLKTYLLSLKKKQNPFKLQNSHHAFYSEFASSDCTSQAHSLNKHSCSASNRGEEHGYFQLSSIASIDKVENIHRQLAHVIDDQL